MKSIDEIAVEAAKASERIVNTVINNNLPPGSCPLEREKRDWKVEQIKDKVRLMLSVSSVGPKEFK